ncbi:CALCIUM-DEPENDENT LIPID-BINDING (CALB DOMAIN) FAMILY PROTEIN [Salix purpurea]|uniref:CALCIUM-DEPENDENT LIPID-BINDING (CALB DOMAIN) FAMILY PROTEIN n=1 Tax=Salix purpurea TaxID=77065 RepID=A0A9Q0TX07_SALPP|nr:CALCIUM-DEPENDENT LIPID-BINDING (CALB DOMAIN) FAMILY PROTEIN [Salix purpurea]
MSHMILSSFQLLELNVISAQDLAKVSRKMKTYAVAWVHPDRRLSTRVDSAGCNNPTWNDKFVFRVDDSFLHADTSAVMIEIYALHWFRDIHIGTVRVIVGNLIPPPRPRHHNQFQLGMRFVALQVRRPSGRPQGILNIGVALLDSSMRSMPLYSQISVSAVGYRQLMGEEELNHHKDDSDDKSSGIHSNSFLLPWLPKPELRRTKSDSSSMFGSIVMARRKMIMKGKGGSMISGSEVEEREMPNKGRSKASSMISGSELEKKKKNKKWRSKASSLINTKSTELDHILKPLPKFTGLDLGSPRNNNFRYATPKKENFVSKPVITGSELGPSASEVAAVIARNKHRRVEETDSEIIGEMSLDGSMEGLRSKLERWRTELPPVYDASDISSFPASGASKGSKAVKRHEHSDDDGTFSCFGVFCGLECSIVCGGPPRRKNTGQGIRSHSMDNLRYPV